MPGCRSTQVAKMAASMCFVLRRQLFKTNIYDSLIQCSVVPSILFNQERCYAARRGTRDALKKKQKEAKLEKLANMKSTGPAGFMRLDRSKMSRTRRVNVEHWLKSPPADDVWSNYYHKNQAFELSEALDMHREMLHPTIFNGPDVLLYTTIELDMKLPKKNKFLEPFSSVVGYPHPFVFREEKKVIAFCGSVQERDEALKAGALAAGGEELIKRFQNGDFPTTAYDHVVAHSEILPMLTPIRGLLKKQFPSKALGNFGTDITYLVKLFRNGVSFTAQRDTFEQDFGWVNVVFGRMGMTNEQLEANFAKIIEGIEQFKPRNVAENFITNTTIWAPPSPEKFHIFFWKLLNNYDDNLCQKKYTILGANHYAIPLATASEEKPEIIADRKSEI